MRVRAAVLEEFGQPLVVQEVDLAEPKAGEALVRLRPDGVEQMRRIARVGSPRAMEAATTVLAENGLAA